MAEHFLGGKGSNQAVTAAKLGADIKLICKIGHDRYAEEAAAMYRSLGLYGDVIIQDETENTSVGAAISIYLGANKNLTVEEVTGKLRSDPE